MKNNDLNFKAFELSKSSLMKSIQELQPDSKANQVVEALDMAKSIYEKHGEWTDSIATHLSLIHISEPTRPY